MQNTDYKKRPLSLIILAAGRGSRFGGDKPLAAVGPNGESLFEYSVHDAFKAGFNHVVFVVSEEQNSNEFSTSLSAYGEALKVEFVIQTQAAFVKPCLNCEWRSRVKPWGTAHAVLVCKEHIRNPFLVINADDYYGVENYQKMAKYLLEHVCCSKACAMSGYKLKNTLSGTGGVNRGICTVSSDGYLESIKEVVNISAGPSGAIRNGDADSSAVISADSIVSMTFWGFVPSIFGILEKEFQTFLKNTPDLIQDEFYLSDTVNAAIKSELLQVKVIDSFEKWMGITYSQDVAVVRNSLLKLAAPKGI